MANAGTFSVFPPPRVPRISMPNPHNRKPSLKTVRGIENGDGLKESVVIALQEIPVPRVPDEHRSPGPFTGQDLTSSAAFKTSVPPPPPLLTSHHTTSTNNGVRSASRSSKGSPEPGSISSADTLVRSASEDEAVVPIRSMFPVYNPNVSLSQQSYYPQRPAPAYTPAKSAAESSHSFAASPHRSPAVQQIQRDAADTPLDVSNHTKPAFSSAKELQRLWRATHVTTQDATVSSFFLQMGRLEDATFTFGSTPDLPFYTLTTYDTSEIDIKKTCPRKRTLVCDVGLTTIEDPSRRIAANDGLVSFIFPKMAAMLAINQSTALADDYDVNDDERAEMQEAAMRRAAAQEASYLRWNPITTRYELEHPAVTRRNRDPNFVVSPQSPQINSRPVIHISVATSDPSTSDQPVILVTCPASLRTPSATTEPGVRSPKSPEMVSEVQLASLDFNTNTLHIETNNILEIMPSIFAVDSIVSALLSVAVADHDANAAMGAMTVWMPDASKLARRSLDDDQSSMGTPRLNAFYATFAEREEAEEEARAAAKTHRKSMKSKSKPSRLAAMSPDEVDVEAGRTWYGKSKARKQRKKKQIVMTEFDLEKLTHYQSGARQGQELPAVTRGALTAMVSALKFVVWLLTAVTQFLAWLMVSVTRGVTSEKF